MSQSQGTSLFRQNTYHRNDEHISPAKVGTGCLEFKLPAWQLARGSGNPPPLPPPTPAQKAQLFFLNHLTVYTSLEVVACWTLDILVFFIGGCLLFSGLNNTGLT